MKIIKCDRCGIETIPKPEELATEHHELKITSIKTVYLKNPKRTRIATREQADKELCSMCLLKLDSWFGQEPEE